MGCKTLVPLHYKQAASLSAAIVFCTNLYIKQSKSAVPAFSNVFAGIFFKQPLTVSIPFHTLLLVDTSPVQVPSAKHVPSALN